MHRGHAVHTRTMAQPPSYPSCPPLLPCALCPPCSARPRRAPKAAQRPAPRRESLSHCALDRKRCTCEPAHAPRTRAPVPARPVAPAFGAATFVFVGFVGARSDCLPPPVFPTIPTQRRRERERRRRKGNQWQTNMMNVHTYLMTNFGACISFGPHAGSSKAAARLGTHGAASCYRNWESGGHNAHRHVLYYFN